MAHSHEGHSHAPGGHSHGGVGGIGHSHGAGANTQTCVLASPYEGLDAPVVASAWGKQLRLESADDSELESFIRTYHQGPQTPEPGAACTGGTAATL